MMTIKSLLELALLIPPDRLVAIRQDDKIPDALAKARRNFGTKIPLIDERFYSYDISFPLKLRGEKRLRFVQHALLDIKEHIPRRPGGDEQLPFEIRSQKSFDSVKVRMDVQIDGVLRSHFHVTVIRRHQK